MKNTPRTRRGRPSEEGYILLFAVFLTALLAIALALAAPQVAKSIQRDKDLETYNRGMQYRRAIQLYYRTFHAYPPTIDALVQTNNIRFLRQKYADPITGKQDWKPILFGQNKVPTAIGFFGQPLAGGATSIVPTGPGGGNTPGGILPGGISNMFGGTNSSFGSNPSSATGIPTDNSGGSNGAAPDPSGNTSGTGPAGGTVASNPTSPDVQTQTFGGAGIIGFRPAVEKKSIRVHKKKNHYNEWEFTYDPISDMQTMSGGNMGNAPGNGSNPNMPGGAFGNPNGGSSGNSSGGSLGGSFGPPPGNSQGSSFGNTTPAPPQQ